MSYDFGVGQDSGASQPAPPGPLDHLPDRQRLSVFRAAGTEGLRTDGDAGRAEPAVPSLCRLRGVGGQRPQCRPCCIAVVCVLRALLPSASRMHLMRLSKELQWFSCRPRYLRAFESAFFETV